MLPTWDGRWCIIRISIAWCRAAVTRAMARAFRPGFLFSVRVLSRLFRRLFLTQLEAAFDAGTLRSFGSLLSLQDRRAFLQHLASARQAD